MEAANRSVLIIGAGVAGLAAASELATTGWNVTLLDKARNAGGRCATRRVTQDPDSPWFDFGAQYFTARHTAFKTFTKAVINSGHLRAWQPTIGAWDDDTINPSSDTETRLIASNGLSGWLRQWAKDLSALPNVTLHFQQQVCELDNHSTGWKACTTQQQTYLAQHLIVTAPPEQTTTLCQDALPSVARKVASFKSAACWSAVVESPARLPFNAIFFKDHPSLNWAADNQSKKPQASQQPSLWTLHANPEWSARNVDADARTIGQQLIDDFSACFPLQSIQNHARLVHTHRWLYARPAEPTTPKEPPFILDANQKIGIAGDWLSGGRVEGAWVSGTLLAQQLDKR